MKLASYKDGSRDGQLVVVSRDLATAHYATGMASRLQQVLDDWNFMAPQLQDLSDLLNAGKTRHSFAFDPARCMAPLPRAYQWLDGSAYPSHADLLGTSVGDEAADMLMYQGGSDDFLGSRDAIVVADEGSGIDFEAELAVITGDVPLAATPEQGLEAVRLLMLVNDVSLRRLVPPELAKRFGFLHGKPATTFGPVAVTPDELGDAWRGGRAHLSMQVRWNGRKVGMCETGPEMRFHFGELIAYAARTRRLRAGTIVGGGTISNAGVEKDGRHDWPRGYSCIAEKRAMETAQDGRAHTGFMKFGDSVRIEVKGRNGRPLLGAIEQTVVPLGAGEGPAAPDAQVVAGG